MAAAAAAEARPVYLDYNATTPIDPEVAQAMLPFLHGGFGNPSSGHAYGREARAAVSRARASVAALVGCDADEVFFTSGGTESNNWALAGAARAHRGPRAHLVVSAVEHPAVAEVAAHLARDEGCAVSVVPVDRQGLVDAGAVLSAVSEKTVLVSIIHANNEVGSVQPIRAIAEAVRPRGVLVHTDASQSLGKVPIDWAELGVDLLSIAGHKIYAPKGVGALIVRKGVKIHNLLHGAGHECGMRAGTESVLLIVGLGKACELAIKYMERDLAHMQNMKERLLKGLLHELVPKQVAMCINSPQEPSLCLPNTLSISFANIDQGKLLDQVLPEVACSAGSACHSGHYSISPVLVAMNVPQHLAQCTLRLSTGRYTTEDEVDLAITTIARAVLSL